MATPDLVFSRQPTRLDLDAVQKLAQERLDYLRSPAAKEVVGKGGIPAQEALASLSWVTCMLMSIAEAAIKANGMLGAASERGASDQLQRAQTSHDSLVRDLEEAQAQRDLVSEENLQLGKQARKEALAARQRQAKDAARIQALTEQNTQLQANVRLSESACAEERRAEQAVAKQRERNLQSVVVRLQSEVESLTQAMAASGMANGHEQDAQSPATVGERAASGSASATIGDVKAGATDADRLVAAHARVSELTAQCDRGVWLIEQLKLRLASQEAEKEQLQAELRSARNHSGGELSARHESEMKVLASELDAAHSAASKREAEARAAAKELKRVNELLAAAETARKEADERAASAVATAEAAAQKASAAKVALLTAAMCESQKKLVAAQRANANATMELNALRPAARSVDDDQSNGMATRASNGGGMKRTPSTTDAARVTFVADDIRPTPYASSGVAQLRRSLLDQLRSERDQLKRPGASAL